MQLVKVAAVTITQVLLLVILSSQFLNAQIEPQPCDDPDNNGIGCYCETAGILCTPDELDGFEFAMSDVANDGDLSGDLCPELPDGGSPHNVNFFAFIVWCETLTFNVLVTNCAPGTNTPSNINNFGIQMALFGNCPAENGGGWNTVECVTNGGETCFDSEAEVPTMQTFTASGLEIGATYYFMVDGCFRSTCKVTIDVQGVCGNGEITDWDNGIFGPQNVCVGDTESYIAEDITVGLDGAEEYYYYLDGNLIEEGEELYEIDVTWDTPGSYQLCVDVSNLPCIPESDSPEQNCITVVVTDPGDGDITATPNPLCPDETTTITVNNNNPDPLLSQYIIVVGPDGLIDEVVEALSTTLTYDSCGVFTAYYYSFVTSDNPTLPMVGDSWMSPDCTADCCYLDEVDITFEDDEAPIFADEPPDETIDCAEDIDPDEELTWTDNCAGTGTVTPILVENYTNCDGGTVTRTWSFTDSCSNNVEYTQTITIDPVAIPEFVDPPADSTINCDIAQIFVPTDLEYNNNGTGGCNIMGTVSPTSSGTFDLCGSSVTYTWEYTDVCNRTISYSQVVTVEEVGAANEFVNPPADTTVTCMEWLSFTPATLSYSNGLSGSCEISGTVDATTTDVHDPCGSSVTYNWEFTDVCGRTITHTQVVTIEPMLEAAFVNPPGNISISCTELQTFVPETLTYTNGGTGACLIEGMVDPTPDSMLDTCGNSVVYTWEFTDICGRTITHDQTVTVEPIAEAAFVNPPGDIVINCDQLQTFTPDILAYTNGEMGNCLIAGFIDPVADGLLDTCGNSVTYTWEFTDQCGRTITHSQLVTVDPIPEASFVNPPGNISIDCDALQTFTPEILTYSNGGTGNCLIEGTVDPVGDGTLDICGNSVTYTWEFTDQCGRFISHSQVVTVDPIPEASFVNPPADVTINCDELQTFTPAILDYTNGGTGNCLISGTVDPVGDGTPDICGNSVTYTWEFTDECNRTISHTQTVTVDPIPEASFVNPPADVTINCDELQTFTPAVLDYTNGGTGNCLISGTVDPVGDGTLDICGNSVTYTWEFTDECNRTISHTQTVTTDPIPEAMFVDPPADVTIDCDELQTFTPAILDYTNGGTGNCLISGTVDPVGDGTLDICGNSVTYTWEFTDECSRTISHTQTVTVDPIPEANFVNPPPNITIDCDELQTFTPAILDYTNGGTGNCLISGTVDPVGDGTLDICGNSVTYTWEFTDECGRTISHTQTVTVEPIPEAMFVDPPADITIECDEFQTFTPAVLDYTNSGMGDCLIEGTVDPVGDGTLDICGNSVTYTWEFTDECNRTISHTQTVTVEPIPEAAFVDPPGDISFNCDDLQAFTPAVLSYTNGGTGGCLIEGTVDPVGDGELDKCGNMVTYTWEFTDECGRTITHNQTVTVEPITPPAFVDPPADETLMCDEKPDQGNGPSLSYTNGGTDDCEIAGEVSPTEDYNVDECGGEIIYTWDFTDECGNNITHTQTITVEPAPQAQLENLPPSSITIACSENTDMGPSLTVTNNESGDCLIEEEIMPTKVGDAGNCGGSFQFVWEFTDDCGRTTSFTQTVNVDPAPAAEFDNLPADITVDCSQNGDTPENLSYSNGETGDCSISGEVPGVRSGTVDYCGGVLIDTWEFTDECGRFITTQRNVNVEPAPPAEYINPPADITVSCDDASTVPGTLAYNNGETGICQISGVSLAVVSGTYDECGGALFLTWSFVDDCGRAISHSQNITVEPAPDPAFINPPGDLTIGCEEIYPGPPNLSYTNGQGGVCAIAGDIVPESDQVDNIITNTWEFAHPCTGELISHTQTVTLSIIPDITVAPSSIFLCLGDTYDLSEIMVDEVNGTNITVTYHSAFPPTPGNEINAEVSPTTDIIYVINAVNEFGCEDFELVNFFIETPPYAGDDQTTTVCSDGIPLNLFDFIPPFADQTGSWLDLDGIGANISNPFAATFNNVPPGNYSLYYVVFSATVCDNDTMVLDITVIDDVSFEITEVTCIGNNDFYEVYLLANGFTIQSTEGDVVHISGDEYVVTNIPITTGVFISAFELVSGCSATEFIDIPNCDCPDIDPPVGDNVSICIDDQPITLTVTVPAGMTANWFDEQNSNTSILDNSTEFTVQDYTAGIYSFFVETYDPATDCSSNVKLKIDVEINNLPEVNDSSVVICDKSNDGFEIVSLQSLNSYVNDNPANTFVYYETLDDAQSESDPMDDTFNLNAGSVTVFVRVTNSADCVSFAMLELTLNPLPTADITATAPSCIGDSDGTINITALDIDGVMLTSIDGMTYEEVTTYTGLSAGTYTVYVQDDNCLNTYMVEVPEGLEIFFTEFTAVCDNNGTVSDATDDFYTINLLIENNLGNTGSYYVIIGGMVEYTFTYGSNESFTIPVDEGNSIEITISDIQYLCNQVQTFGPLNPCSTNCDISIDELEFECMDNGTSTDPSDDYYVVNINCSALNGASNNTYNVFLGGILLYNFTYGELETFEVNADGSNLTITCQDNEDVQCQTSMDIGPLNSCSEGCQIELVTVSEMCNNNGTSTNQDDDFYTYTILGNVINGVDLDQYELFVDGISQGFYNYGEEVQFDINADGMTHTVTIADDGNAGCEDEFTTVALDDCSTDCEILLNAADELCFNNNTPQDSDDDYYEITINVSSVNGAANGLFNLYVDGSYINDYPYDTDNVITITADGAIHEIRIQDSEELACELIINTSQLVSCSDGCLNEIEIVDFECFDNGTATNIDDDFFEFNIQGILLNGASNSQFELFVDGISEGIYSYDEIINITLPADGEIHNFQIVDADDASCVFDIATEELNSCSTDCEINAQDIVYSCSDNGTPTDPTDDTVELTVNASAINGSTTQMYNLYVDGILEGIYSYGTAVTITLDADGESVTLRFQDSQDLQCDLEVETDPLDPCSDGCLIGLNVLNLQCFNNDTPTDVNDDYYEITIQGEVLNGMPTTGIEVFVDGNSQGTVGYDTDFVVVVPADDLVHEIVIVDQDDDTCTDSFTTAQLNSCSTDCEISISNLVSTCLDNGTLDDPSDDYYEISFVAEAINGSNAFGLTAFGSSQGTFNYGTTVNLTFPADGENLILLLTDLADAQCQLNEVIGALEPCSDLCTIEPMIMESECFDNGTPIDPFDDYWEITIFVNPANGETAPNYELSIDGNLEGTYPYSENVVITIPADNASHVITVNDEVDADCDAVVNTEVLGYCSTPCEIEASYDNVICDNNGTNDTGDDDLYYLDLTVTNPDAGQYEIPLLSISGNYNETITIGPLNIADGTISIDIVDGVQNLCFISLELVPPAPCSDCEQTADAGQGGTLSCENTEIILMGSSSDPGEYFWYGPAGNLVSEDLVATAVSVGTYTFRVEFEDGCVAESTVEVDADTDLPIATLTNDGAITCDKTSSVLDGSASGSTDDFFYYWFDENDNLVSEDPVLETDVPGVYFLQIEAKDNNCKSALEATIVEDMTEEPIAIIVAEPSNIIDCSIESILLSSQEEEDNVEYTWSFNGVPLDNTSQLIISQIGTYGLLVVDTITGCSDYDEEVITSLVEYPGISLEAPEMLNCENFEISITASSIHASDSLTSYWQDSDLNIILENQDVLQVTEPGEYYYTLIDNNNGCENTDSILIELIETEVDIITEPEVTYTEGDAVTLTATVNLDPSEIGSIQWTPDENMSCPTCLTTRIVDPTDSIYTITVVDINGCVDTAQVLLIREDRPEIFVPNVFNPGSTTGNDKFVIFGNEEVESVLKVMVYDRWGNLVYIGANLTPNDKSEGWDGTFNGQDVEQGVYVYMIEALFKNGNIVNYFGDLTIIR